MYDTAGNPFIGPPPSMNRIDVSSEVVPSEQVAGLDFTGPDGSERIVALFILGALAVLVLFRWAGFQAVITGKVGFGG